MGAPERRPFGRDIDIYLGFMSRQPPCFVEQISEREFIHSFLLFVTMREQLISSPGA